jgi:gliding motility-associated-like protein
MFITFGAIRPLPAKSISLKEMLYYYDEFLLPKKGPMKKTLLLIGCVCVLVGLTPDVRASHIVGGEMSYECLGGDQYLITLKVYRDCYNGLAGYDNPTNIFIWNSNCQLISTLPVPFPGSDTLDNNPGNPCLIVPPGICVEEAVFTYTVTLPANSGGYTMAYVRCCRNNLIQNILDPSNTGGSYIATIPDTSLAECNSSPIYNNFPPTVICVNQPFSFDHSATDADGDSLVYELCAPYIGGDAFNPYPNPPTCPPYPFVTYVNPYSATDPMGGSPPLTIDPQTGLMTGTPNTEGNFVVGVCVKEYRNGELLSEHKRDFQFNVVECTPAVTAATPPVINNCAAYTVTFENNSNGGDTYHWDFGVPGSADTSNLFQPTYTFPDTGVYTVTLIVNPGTTCGDTTTATVYIYPTLNVSMAAPDGCEGNPVQFYDQSSSAFGVIDTWGWNFGDGGTSNLADPLHAYANTGTYTVTFYAQNDLGCVDTITETVVIYPSPETEIVPDDTIICSLDAIQLFASGTGNFAWEPDYNLSNNNVANPMASPDVTTTYTVTLSNQFGCFDQDSVTITVFDSVGVYAGNDTTICPGGAVQLNGQGGLVFQWTPSSGLSDPTIPNPVATPQTTTTYVLNSSIGSCTGSDAITIVVKPFPTVNAGPDVSICGGETIQLLATGCTDYSWSPPAGLSDPNIANPLANPSATTTYTVSATDDNSCPIVVTDEVTVSVIPIPTIFTSPDTSIILGTCTDLFAAGGSVYQWNPGSGLDNPNSQTPIACPTELTTYTVTITTSDGCVYYDSVTIDIRLDPILVFPTAFSPNDDGKNDFFRPVILGLARINELRVYNRWGEEVFSISGVDVAGGPLPTDLSWDGKYKGEEQPVGVYVYYLSGVATATGKTIDRKGDITLVR